MKKTLVVLLTLVVLVAGLSLVAPAKTKLDVMFWWEVDNPALVLMKKEFNEKYQDIELNFINVPSKEFYDKLLTITAAGAAPDVAMLGMDKLATFASKGALTDLSELVKQSYPVNDLFASVKGSLTYKGKWYAMPRDTTSTVMYYNRKIFREHGVPYPKEGWTWNDFLEAAKKTTHKGPDGKYAHWGFNYDDYADGFIMWLWANGGDFLNEDCDKSILSSKASVEALQWLVDLRLKHHVAPTIPEQMSIGKEEDLFRVQKIAMYVGGVSRTNTFGKVKELDWDVAPLPKGKKGATARIWTNLWVIPKGTKNLEAAWKFLSFVGGPEGQRIASKMNMGIPALRSVAKEDHFLNQPPEHRYYFLDAFEDGRVFPIFPEGKDYWDNLVRPELGPVWLGQRSVTDAAAAIDKVANEQLFKK